MRDRNLPYKQFNIQLEKNILQNFKKFETRRITFSQELSFEFRPYTNHREVKISFPKEYRLLRVLSIIQWYLPENLHFLVYIQLKEQDFSWLSEKQRIEINLFLESKEDMVKYLYLTERYTGNEIFGNILGNDLKDLIKRTKIFLVKYPIPTEKVYRRGPKDKGSRRVNSSASIIQEEISKDIFLQIEELKRVKRKLRLQSTINLILKILRNSDLEEGILE
jgi:hypothetical protein